jgi:hypothetical protein
MPPFSVIDGALQSIENGVVLDPEVTVSLSMEAMTAEFCVLAGIAVGSS